MHALWLVELTAAMALQTPIWSQQSSGLPGAKVKGYWTFSRQRLNQWHEQLHRIREQLNRPGAIRRAALWAEAQPVIEEVLLSEMLTRYFACFTNHLERHGTDLDSSPIARNIFQGHLEVRNRCLQLLVYAPGLPVELSVHLNRIRHLMERWSDQLFAGLADDMEVEPYCFELEHVQAMARERSVGEDAVSNRLWWSLLLAGFRGNVSGRLDRRSNSPRLNGMIAQQILGMVSHDQFDGLGLLKSIRMRSLESICDETDGKDDGAPYQLSTPLNTLLTPQRETIRINRLH